MSPPQSTSSPGAAAPGRIASAVFERVAVGSAAAVPRNTNSAMRIPLSQLLRDARAPSLCIAVAAALPATPASPWRPRAIPIIVAAFVIPAVLAALGGSPAIRRPGAARRAIGGAGLWLAWATRRPDVGRRFVLPSRDGSGRDNLAGAST